MKQIIFIAGPNGSGKTTGAFILLPDFFKTNEFINADEIARGLSPLNPDSVPFESGKIMIQRIRELSKKGRSFGIETTLSGRSYESFISKVQSQNYKVGIIFLYLNSISLAKKRVAHRAAQGGHDIPIQTIKRRYIRGIKNLINIYLPLSDWTYIFDNSIQKESQSIYFKINNTRQSIIDQHLWREINEQARQG